jgi:putative transcriptional regulator
MGVKNRLKEIRMREYMMSSGEFAKYLEVPVTVYSGWETNSSRPKLEKAFEIARKLNRKVDDIWFYE